jgi:hypothetical protein
VNLSLKVVASYRFVGRLLSGVIFFCAASLLLAQAPYVKTQEAGPVRATHGTLNGMAVPRGQQTIAWFEWGTNTNLENVTPPQALGNGIHVVRVSAQIADLVEGGVYHFRLVASNSLGVVRGFGMRFTTGMRVANWGSFDFHPPIIHPGLTNLSSVASGHRHCLGVRNDGTVVAWAGSDFLNFNRGQTNVPAGLSNVVAVAGGFSHSLALKEDGTVVAWGGYGNGVTADVPANLTNVIAVGGGDYHSVALKADGTVVQWGTQTNPMPSGLVDVVAISCGTAHTLALKADGRVSVWGNDAGSGSPPSSATNVVSVATMGWWNLGLRSNGTVVEWGPNFYLDIPKPNNLTNVVGIVTGYGYAEVLHVDGTLSGWGRGQDATNIPLSLSNVVAFASGDYHRVGLTPVNLPPTTRSFTYSRGMNLSVTPGLGVFDANGDPIVTRITALPLKGTLYQYTANGPGEPIIAVDTIVTSSPPRVIFVPESGVYQTPYDSFSFVANDGTQDSTPATYTFNVTAPPPPSIQTASLETGPTDAFMLTFAGASNATFSVWHSTNLLTWSFLGVPNQVLAGQFSFKDEGITNFPAGFYQIRSP